MADYRGSKKAFLGAFLALGAAATAGLSLAAEGQWVYALVAFVIANVGVTSTLAFYNALLPGDRLRRARWTGSRQPDSPGATWVVASSSRSTCG